MFRSPALLPVLAFALLACQGGRETPPAAGTAAAGPPAGKASAEPWQYTPALRAAVKESGSVVEPVFELADGRTGRAQIGVAVGTGTQLRLEVWDFDQNNPRERLERVGEPRRLVALDGSGGRAEIDAVRKAIAQPGNEYVRPRGIEGSPEALPGELGELARLIDDGKEPIEQRVRALARLVRALDDHALFEANLLPALLEALPTGREVARTEALGERRVRVILKEPAHVLVFARSGERWALTDVEWAHSSAPAAPAAEPSPTAP